ncbi:MAG: hypothetical protein WHV44_00105 [Anaerolineales bacterium]
MQRLLFPFLFLALLLSACGAPSTEAPTPIDVAALSTQAAATVIAEATAAAPTPAPTSLPAPTATPDMCQQTGALATLKIYYLRDSTSGNLYVNTPDGQNEQIAWSVPGMTFASISPDGLHGVAHLGPTVRQLGKLGDPNPLANLTSFYAWSPAGDKIADYDGSTLNLRNADGSNLLTFTFDNNIREMKWSPDGTRLAVLVGTASVQIIEPANGSVLPIYSESDPQAWQVFTSMLQDGTALLWAPNSQALAFQIVQGSASRLAVYDFNGGELIIHENVRSALAFSETSDAMLVVDPDSGALAHMIGLKQDKTINPFAESKLNMVIQQIFWFGGDKLAVSFFANENGVYVPYVKIMGYGLRDSQNLNVEGTGYPSPGYQYIGFLAPPRPDTPKLGPAKLSAELTILDFATSTIKTLSIPPYSAQRYQYGVSFSPDGRYMAFYNRGTNLNQELFIYDHCNGQVSKTGLSVLLPDYPLATFKNAGEYIFSWE